MAKKTPEDPRQSALRRIAEIRDALAALEFVCSGTLLERTKTCGKPNCRCAQDPNERHGPYYEWSRRSKGRLVHRVVTPAQAKVLREAIANHRRILKLLEQWERQTARVIDALDDPKRKKRRSLHRRKKGGEKSGM